MANQGNRENPEPGNDNEQRDRDREGNLGQPPEGGMNNPTGTSGRSDNPGGSRRRPEEEEESGLGNRTTNR